MTPDLHLLLRQRLGAEDVVHGLAGFVVVPLMPPLIYSARLGPPVEAIDFNRAAAPPPGLESS